MKIREKLIFGPTDLGESFLTTLSFCSVLEYKHSLEIAEDWVYVRSVGESQELVLDWASDSGLREIPNLTCVPASLAKPQK